MNKKRIFKSWKRNADGVCINSDGKPRLNSRGLKKYNQLKALDKEKSSHRMMIFGDCPDELV